MVATFEMFSPDAGSPTGEQPEIELATTMAVAHSFEIDPIQTDPEE